MDEQIGRIIKEVLGDNVSVDPGVDIITDLGADSLDFVEILMRLEKTYGIRIPDSDVDLVRSPQGIKEYISNYDKDIIC